MHATEPNTNLRHQKRVTASIFFTLVNVIFEHSVLFFGKLEVKLWIFKFIYYLISDYMRIRREFLLSHFWLFWEVSVKSNEHVKIPRGSGICRDILTAFGWDWGLAHDGGEFDVFEEFLEEFNEKWEDFVEIGVHDVEDL